VWCSEAPVLTVGKDAGEVERRLTGSGLACPGCRGRLRPWGHGRARVVRDDGEVRWRFRPRRARCAGCGVTHVLLPVTVLVRRADMVAVIGAALVWAAAGWGHRRMAERLGRSASTVRGWLRRFRRRAGPLREAFTGLLCGLDAGPLLPAPAGSDVADAVAAIVAAAGAVARRWAVLAVSPWLVAAAVTSGRLLARGSTVELTNTSCPW
jgi:Homeodomain-like domain-containing protein